MPELTAAYPVFVHAKRLQGHLTPNVFGELLGVFDHATTTPEGKTRPDNNHVYLWIRVASGPFAGAFECAVNIHSTDGSLVQYSDMLEDRTGKPVSAAGFTQMPLSYATLGVTQANFKSVQDGDLYTLLTGYARTCDQMVAFGHTYSDGTGLHDVHQNSGEPKSSGHSNQTGQDGALAFYFNSTAQANAQGSPKPYARWVLVKFATQTLP